MNAYYFQTKMLLTFGECYVTMQTSIKDIILDGINWEKDTKELKEVLFRNANLMRTDLGFWIISVIEL